MAGLIQPVRGMNDVLPGDAAAWAFVESSARDLLDGYGYTQIRTPAVERTELFKRSIGEATDIVEKEMYTFEDRNGDSLTLRPEATAGMVRAGLSHGLFHNQQQRLWCSGPMFRHEKPQKARYRQFHQLSVEAVGFAGPEIDAELIAISARLWRVLGLKSPTLELNSLGTPQSRARYRESLVAYLSDHHDALDADSRRRLETNPLRILDSKNPELAELIEGAPLLADFLDADSQDHFEQVKQLLEDVGIDFVLNPRLVRGLDYYSRTVFEWVTDRLGAQGAICSGGRYDGLVAQLGGRDTPASGWALGFERVVELLAAEGTDVPEQVPDAYLVTAGDEARRRGFAVAEALRSELPAFKLAMDCTAAGFKAQLRRADRSGARLALIIGDVELGSNSIGVKPLRSDAPQTTVKLEELAAVLLREAAQ
ncbi:MAG: histidine--tRNA ligase [Gammaproteobacteria bacterium]|nr:histidine--tRNA ligase [Gammaproteobacteria bacterium]